MTAVIIVIAGLFFPVLLIITIHFFAKYKITKKALEEEKQVSSEILVKLKIKTDELKKKSEEYNQVTSDYWELMEKSVPKFTVDPKKMTYEQLESCMNYFIENVYGKSTMMADKITKA